MAARQSYKADYKVIDASRRTLLIAIGRLFHSHRVSRRLTQTALAAEVPGLHQISVSAVENGRCIHAEQVESLATHLGIPPRFVAVYVALIHARQATTTNR